MEGRSYLLAYALDTAHGLNIQLLGRELDGGVARVNTSKLDMLADGIGQYFAVLGDSVHLYLLGMLDKFAHHHGMVYAHIGRQLQELLQLVLIGAYIHGCSRQYIGWTDEYGETYTVDKLADILHTGKCAPFGLVDTTLGEHGRELGTVFGIVDILGRCTQDWHILGIEPHGKVVRNLSTGRHHHAMRILHLDDVKHTLEGELVKV